MDSVTERNTVNVIFRHHGDIESNTPTQKGTLERPQGERHATPVNAILQRAMEETPGKAGSLHIALSSPHIITRA